MKDINQQDGILTDLELWLADINHIFIQVSKIIQIWQNGGWPPFCQIWIILLTWMKMWLMSASHNSKSVKIPIE